MSNRSVLLLLDFRDLPQIFLSQVELPWARLKGYSKKEMSVVGEACVLGDKVTMKQSCLGAGCNVGAKTKLNSCVVMDGVVIGEGYVYLFVSLEAFPRPNSSCFFFLCVVH